MASLFPSGKESAIELPVLVPTIIWGDHNAQMHYLTALNAESAEQAGHARLLQLGTVMERSKVKTFRAELNPRSYCKVRLGTIFRALNSNAT